ncbi:MAG: DJ-1/PfpI family protein [Clostridia bacterium]|nr:DJ-1/PfpI family protein [Clostridia bacterium]
MIYIFLADGFEEVEATTPRDILKRAGISIQTVGLNQSDTVSSASGLKIIPDVQIEHINFNDIEGIILPGGMPGTKNLEQNKKVLEIIKYCIENKLLIGAICAAPSILGKMGVLKNKAACCYPGFEKYLIGAKISENSVSTDKNIITSKGPGTAFEFGFAVLKYLKGRENAESIKSSMIYR